MNPRDAAQVMRRARAVTSALGTGRPPVRLERAAARCGISEIRRVDAPREAARLLGAAGGAAVLAVDRRIPSHTPQWNALVALAAGRLLLPAGGDAAHDEELAEVAAAELLLPARAFAPVAARTDLTMDGVRDLARRFSAPIRLTVRQWLLTGAWRGLALLWREDAALPRLAWRAASPGVEFPPTLRIGAAAGEVWAEPARLCAALRTGRPHHGVEEVSTGEGRAWWFTRFGVVRDGGGRAALALVILDRPGEVARRRLPEGIDSGPANRKPRSGRRSPARRRR